MGKFTKQEKGILLIIVIAAFIGVVVNVAFSYSKKIEITPAAKTFQKININTADAETLSKLPGIGPSYAERIIEHRKTSRFESTADLKKVKGIGPKKFQKIEHLITIR